MKKAILVGIAAGFAITLLVVLGLQLRFKFSNREKFYGKPRKQWKELAIAEVASRGADSVRLTNEVAKIKAALANDTQAWWSSQGLLVMQNGEWMLCTNVCNKQDSRIHDLFIGQGSDGQWYYSDFHFCIGMIGLEVLGIGPPPISRTLLRLARSATSTVILTSAFSQHGTIKANQRCLN